MSTKTSIQRIAATVLLTGALGATAMMNVATTALAPEPAKLGASSLGGTVTNTVAAAYVNSGASTTIINWPSSLRTRTSAVTAGMPCSPVGLAAYSTTLYSIVVIGSQAKCI